MRRPKLLILFFLPTVCLYVVYYFIMAKFVFPSSSPTATRALVSIDYAKSLSGKEVDYLITGDSTALYSIDPRELGAKSYSIAMVGGTFYSSYQSLNSLKNVKINRGVLITQTFISDHYENDIWGIFVPARIWSRDDVIQILCSVKKNECPFLNKMILSLKYYFSRFYLTPYVFKELIQRINYYDKSFEGLYDSFYSKMSAANGFFSRKPKEELDRSMLLQSFHKHFSQDVYQDVPVTEEAYLVKMIQFAQEKGIILYYVIPPTAASSLGVSTVNYSTNIIKKLSPFIGPHFQIIDSSEIESQLKIEDFWDFNHLNTIGTKKMGEYLRLRLSN